MEAITNIVQESGITKYIEEYAHEYTGEEILEKLNGEEIEITDVDYSPDGNDGMDIFFDLKVNGENKTFFKEYYSRHGPSMNRDDEGKVIGYDNLMKDMIEEWKRGECDIITEMLEKMEMSQKEMDNLYYYVC